jgi:hypothetical protein
MAVGFRHWTGGEPISRHPGGVPILDGLAAHDAFKAAERGVMRYPSLIDWFCKQILRYSFEDFLGTNAHLLLDVCTRDNARRSAMFGRQANFQSEKLMADVYLGIAVAGLNTLIVLCVALTVVVI